MKRLTLIIAFLCVLVTWVRAQEPRFIFDRDSTDVAAEPKVPPLGKNTTDTIPYDSLNKVLPPMPAWRIDARLGERIPVVMDTVFKNYHQESLVDGQGVAVGYLGNWGSPAQSKIFFERGETSQFYFLDPFKYYYKKPDNHVFLDTKVPYSNITYHSGGGKNGKEERFIGEMSISFNKKLTVGIDVDYVYSRGFYQSLANKQTNYDIFASYKTDRYQMHVFASNNNFRNVENGGINPVDGLDSDFLDGDSKSIDTNISDTWNNLRGRNLYMTHKYSIGYDENESEKFIPVASLIFTSHYTDQKRYFKSDQVQLLDSIYNYKSTIPEVTGNASSGSSMQKIDELMSYYSFKNTLGISLNEGFREWVKFGLTAFIEQDFRKYAMPGERFPSLSTTKHSQSSTVIGGVLSKEKGEFLRYNLSADFCVAGDNIGESRLKADISTLINIKGKKALIRANGYIKTLKPTFFESQYSSRYFSWSKEDTDFNNTTRLYAGGEIYLPQTNTRLSGGFESLQDYLYYKMGDDGKPGINQAGKNIQVIALRLDQNFKAGVLHWDNQVVFQHSSDEDIIPLPKLSLYSNLYLQVKLAKVLDIQLGVDAHFHSKYYAPAYDPVLLQFYNQNVGEGREGTKIGNFPFSTVYANFHLKRTRFFVMMYNVGKGLSSDNYFTLDRYPVNPMIFKFGLSWNFMN